MGRRDEDIGRPGDPVPAGDTRAHGGPPPWVAGLFGMGEPQRGRGPRVRRGDVRSAILDVLHAAVRWEEPINGYQVIQQIGERSNDAWRPSPGSVYPTIQQLQDEGLVESDDERGRRTIRLSADGRALLRGARRGAGRGVDPFRGGGIGARRVRASTSRT